MVDGSSPGTDCEVETRELELGLQPNKMATICIYGIVHTLVFYLHHLHQWSKYMVSHRLSTTV